MSTTIAAVNNTAVIRDAEFIKLAIVFTNGTTQTTRYYYFSTSYKPETISGDTYADLGALTGVSAYQRDISSSGFDTSVTITGLDPLYIYLVAGGPATAPIPVTGQSDIPVGYYPLIKGSTVQIRRGFYDSNMVLTSNVLRYTGIITSYVIQEERDNTFEALNDTYTISLQCSAYRQVLENRIAGRKTNQQNWQYWYPTDTSMNRVAGLEGKQFDFGKDPVTGSAGGTGGNGGTDNYDRNRDVDQLNP
jgi:hypothetical protein